MSMLSGINKNNEKFANQAKYSGVTFPVGYFDDEEFTMAEDFSGSDLIWVKKDGQYGYLNRHNRRLLMPGLDFESALPFSCGRGVVTRNGKHGAIDENGNYVVDLIYDSLTSYKDGVAYCEIDGKSGCVDVNGNAICEPIYDYVKTFHEGFSAVCLNNRWGYVDKQGNRKGLMIFDLAFDFSCGLARVWFDGNVNYVGTNGIVAIRSPLTCPYQDGRDFVNDYAGVKQKGKWGYIDKNGKKVIPCRYQDVGDFKDGMFPVENDDKWGYIANSDEEKFIVPCTLKFPLEDDEKMDQSAITRIQGYYKEKANGCKTVKQKENCVAECRKEVAKYKKARQLYNDYIEQQKKLEEAQERCFNEINNID